jgi:hypothetical protein
MRRKSKPIPKSSHNDERKVGETAKKAGLQQIGAMDEANIIFSDGKVTQITSPRVWGLLQANSFVVHGTSSEKTIAQLSPDMRGDATAQAPAGGGGGMGGLPPAFQSAAMKLKSALDKAGLKDSDVSDPSKAEDLKKVMEGLSLTDEEGQALSMLMQLSGPGAAGAEGAGAEGEDETPA